MTNTEEKILKIYQEFIGDKSIVLNERQQKAFCMAIGKALDGYKVFGKEEDIKTFKRHLPRFATHHNVTVEEN